MMKRKNTTFKLNKVDLFIFIICSILAGYMFYLFYEDMNSFSIKQDESPIALIDFKENQVQRKFENRNIWEKINLASSIYDGDVLRTADNSTVNAVFLNLDAKIQLNENSMIQIFQNKKKDCVNFMSGEIQFKNNSKERPIVLQTGIKEISIMEDSEVKVAVQNKDSDSKETVIDVVSGEIEISDIKEVLKAKKEKEGRKQKVSAGGTASFKFVEFNPEVLSEITQNVSQVNNKDDFEEEQEEIQVIENIEEDISGDRVFNTAKFSYSVYDPVNNRYNYSVGTELSKLLGENKRIPKGSAVEFTISGIPDNFINNFAIQVSSGEDDWFEANSFRWESLGSQNGALPGEKFVDKRIVVLYREIKNTSKSYVNISYESNFLDKEVNLNDFEIKAKVITKNVYSKLVNLNKNLYKEFAFDTAYLGRDGSCYIYSVNAEDIFGNYISIPKGTKVKIHLEGVVSKDIYWADLMLVNEQWNSAAVKNPSNLEDKNFLKDEIHKGVPFNFDQTYTFVSDVSIINDYSFRLSFYEDSGTAININNFKISFEIVE